MNGRVGSDVGLVVANAGLRPGWPSGGAGAAGRDSAAYTRPVGKGATLTGIAGFMAGGL